MSGTEVQFNQVQGRRRRVEILKYLGECVPDRDENVQLRQAIIGDLGDLGIQL